MHCPLLLLALLCCLDRGNCRVTIGILTSLNPNNWDYFFSQASAMTMAQEHLIERGIIKNDTISKIVWRDTADESAGLGNLVDLRMNENVDIIFGPQSSAVLLSVAHLTSYWNLPTISWSALDIRLANKAVFSTLVRTSRTIGDLGTTFLTIFNHLNWSKLGMLTSDYVLCKIYSGGVQKSFANSNASIVHYIEVYANQFKSKDARQEEYLLLIKQTSRVVFLCVETLTELRQILIEACLVGMCDGSYVFFVVDQIPTYGRPWIVGDEYDTLATKGFKQVINLSPAKWSDDATKAKLDKFYKDVIDRMAEPPWQNTYARDNNMTASDNSEALYLATYLYGMWLNYSSEQRIQHTDGARFLQFTKGLSFDGIADRCQMDNNGDRLMNYWVTQLDQQTLNFRPVAISKYLNKDLDIFGNGFYWKTPDGQVPRDDPICGFYGELCVIDEHDHALVTGMVTLSVGSLCFGLIGLLLLIRKQRNYMDQLYDSWRVVPEDIIITKSQPTLGSLAKNIGSRADRSMSDSLRAHHPHGQYLDVANYKGRKVTVRRVTRKEIISSKDMLILKCMREMAHENMNPFIGACFDLPSPCILFTHCSKGSLQVILQTDDIKLDQMFKTSLIRDLLEGMVYIHNSRLGHHGRLKSTNCLVDNRWMLKITDYGINQVLQHDDLIFTDSNIGEQEFYNSLLWSAPELLLNFRELIRGSKAGDVYSFGIILHEICCRMGTFAGHSSITAKDIVGRVKNMETQPCRPVLCGEVEEMGQPWISLMTQCWEEKPQMRPTFASIAANVHENLRDKTNSKSLVDVVLNRLEKYASNLEELVSTRTEELMHEKLKSDRLLYQMLPKSCAEKLRAGLSVSPEMFESATLFFSDIVGFTRLAADSSPIQVIAFLNDLYACVDAIIQHTDAYKVETIGDAYLVVSGIPIRNGISHAGIIAELALDIRAAVLVFKIRHFPERRLQLRIGVHTGPCCAGIIGLSMPRYSLFGDTVNTASRMESTGEPDKIQISQTTRDLLMATGAYNINFRGDIQVKGKNTMTTYWLDGRNEVTIDRPSVSDATNHLGLLF